MKVYLPILKWLISLGKKAEAGPAVYAHGGMQPASDHEVNNLEIPHRIPMSLAAIHGQRFEGMSEDLTEYKFMAWLIIPKDPAQIDHSTVLIDYENESRESEAMAIDVFISEVIQGRWTQC